MDLEITPQPSDEERAAIEAALVLQAREEQTSAWAARLLPGREGQLPEPYPQGPPVR
jgi:hypothetical protein